ncbi:uncharacterized protein UV8b_05678 [Ustilaginoidea virens]|uniref:Uncharacterized protein n=1 Tax=Ustilaginoidea virens TaxID=1159556 RepID=A0A8E5HU40_USTVR|nr:uncharacterized protein UV8b_05678 [Ustilaginoidea virens]QUC21435.1 hypothetical protein UV8b_05678 [Ustilaginoidea virens]
MHAALAKMIGTEERAKSSSSSLGKFSASVEWTDVAKTLGASNQVPAALCVRLNGSSPAEQHDGYKVARA